MPLFLKKSSQDSEGYQVQVRATLAILFSVAVIWGFFQGLVSQDAFLSIAIMAISWYFSKRSLEDETTKKDDKPL